MAFNMILINGKAYPSPDKDFSFEVATFVDGGKNASGSFVGQKIGRDQYKVNDITWSYLTAEDWSAILKEFDKFVVSVTFPDMVNDRMITLNMYPGNRTATPLEYSKETGLPISYKNCKVNIIDCGE